MVKIYKTACLLFMIIVGASCCYGQLWKQFADSAKVFQEQKKTDSAISWYKKALNELEKDSAGSNSYAIYCTNLAKLYRVINQNKEAEPLFLEACQIKEKLFGKQSLEYANAYHFVAVIFFELGKYEKAEPAYIEAKKIREKLLGKNSPEYALSANGLGFYYWQIGQFSKAEPLLLEAKQIREKLFGKENADYAKTCSDLAALYHDMGQYEKAEPLCIEAKQIREKLFGKHNSDYAESCENLAVIYKGMGQFDKAEQLMMEDRRITEEIVGRQHLFYAVTLNNLGSLYTFKGEYEKSEMLYLESEKIVEKIYGNNHPLYARCIGNLGIFYQLIGQYDKAESLLLESRQIFEKRFGKEHADYAFSCYFLAEFYNEIGQFEKAGPFYLEAKQTQERLIGKAHPNYAFSCNGLADFYMKMGQYKKAELLFLEAKQILGKLFGKEEQNYASSCVGLASVYQFTGQFKKATALYLEAKQAQQKTLGKQHPLYKQTCEKLANLYTLMHMPSQADKGFEESFSVDKSNVSTVFQFTNEKEKAAYLKNITGEDAEAYSFYITEKIASWLPYSLSLFHRNLILSSSENLKKQIFSTNDTTLLNKYISWTNLKKQLSILYSQPSDEGNKNITKIEDRAGLLEKELSRFSPVFAKYHQKIDWKEIQNSLKPEEASIEFASFHFNNGKRTTDTVMYIAIILRKDMPLPITVPLFNESQLNDLLVSAGGRATSGAIQKLYTLANGATINGKSTRKKSLYELIWKPIEKELKGMNTIYFAPVGILHRIAFAALPINNKEVLGDKYKLVQLATTASVTDQQRYHIAEADKIELYGGISYDVDTVFLKDVAMAYHKENVVNRSLPDDATRGTGWQTLPGTKEEINGIVSLSGKYQKNITALSGPNATEESLKALDGTASPAVLHIATHGFFFPDTKRDKGQQKNFENGTAFKQSDDPLMRSGLLFSGANNAWKNKPVQGIDDGILTAYEVSNLYLPNTKLVVLSACETGLGEIHGSEGVYGLQRAFKIAGAQNLVMSLWKVTDAETAEFMELFYKNLFAQQSIGDAFYGAQNTKKDKYRKQPYKWAAWVLVR